MATSLTYHIAY